MIKKRSKIIVAMSGGVDSSVAAALLKKAGFEVVGIFMKCWSAELSPACTSKEDERMARLAASHLNIPFYAVNFIDEYKKRVVDYLLEGYRKGITPNPDAMCNKEIKFGLFFEKAIQLGAAYVATGHYARLKDGKLREAVDENKDQSYFLSFIKPEVLSKVLFPIGEHTKPQVRELARRFGLPNAERKDSQGICFVGKVDVVDFLKHYLPVKPGKIIDVQGTVLGTHEGAQYYTIGQRKGIGLGGGPYYVVQKDIDRNILVVSKNEEGLYQKELILRDINWLSGDTRKNLISVDARIRYRQHLAPATLSKIGDAYKLTFQTPQRAITPGQVAALYQDTQLIAGGVIV
ncbi:MAG: tRNA 2-thiouridine(34) synthase MnmA [Parcubacteria group bacterium]|nr:tRNA 2-thiouridine(34) synthase MnmA [Parcubacteria group bacterium]